MISEHKHILYSFMISNEIRIPMPCPEYSNHVLDCFTYLRVLPQVCVLDFLTYLRVLHRPDAHTPPRFSSLKRQHTSAYVSIRQHTSYLRVLHPPDAHTPPRISSLRRQHTSAYVSIRQHTSAYVSIRQHTPPRISSLSCKP